MKKARAAMEVTVAGAGDVGCGGQCHCHEEFRQRGGAACADGSVFPAQEGRTARFFHVNLIPRT